MPAKTEKSILDNILAYATHLVQDQIGVILAVEGQLCESPLERVMLAALVAVIEIEERWPLNIIPPEIAMKSGGGRLCLSPQVQLEDYRVDFLLADARFKNPVRIVIECDGHDFHERTQDQALRDRSRDRVVQALGAKIVRFTGREIWRDPIACAREVFDFLEIAANEEAGR